MCVGGAHPARAQIYPHISPKSRATPCALEIPVKEPTPHGVRSEHAAVRARKADNERPGGLRV